MNSNWHQGRFRYSSVRKITVRRLVSIAATMLSAISIPPTKSLWCRQSRKEGSPSSKRGSNSSQIHALSLPAYDTKASNSWKYHHVTPFLICTHITPHRPPYSDNQNLACRLHCDCIIITDTSYCSNWKNYFHQNSSWHSMGDCLCDCVWISNYIDVKIWNVIAHPCHNLNSSLVKSVATLGHGHTTEAVTCDNLLILFYHWNSG